jgi:hopanoid biosynthesis associated RND transporter like protein HpnN
LQRNTTMQPEGWVSRAVAWLVGLSLAHARLVLLIYAALTAAAVQVTITRFELTSDVTLLFPQDLPWRATERQLAAAFPQREDIIAIVVDGRSAAQADRVAAALAESLTATHGLFRRVARPDAGPFFERHAALYLTLPEVQSLTERLIEAQPLLGALAADPSLRGLAELLRNAMEGVAGGDTTLAPLEVPLTAFAEAAEAAVAGRILEPDWAQMITGRMPHPLETRRFVLAQPRLDFAVLAAGAAATDAIRAIARGLSEPGIRIRLTGPIPMADEEFGTLADGAVQNILLSMVLTGLLLWMALRSWRLIIPLLVLVVAGLAWTAAFGLLAVGRFNPLSIAFAVLFIGLGVDFGIQYAVQYRAERRAAGALRPALLRAGLVAGPGMTLAAMACMLSFFAFIPTEYLGVSELGLISGAGMLIGWVMAMTLLPALMLVARPRAEAREVGYPGLAPLDAWLVRRAGWVAGGAALLAVACTALLPALRFDTDPINLRDKSSEAVATYIELMGAMETTPNTLDMVAPDLAAAQALAARLAQLPEVGRALSLADFIPAAQPEKLALLEDASMLLAPAFLAQPAMPPSDSAVAAALAQAGLALRGALGEDRAARQARRLGQAFLTLGAAQPADRERLAQALLPGLATVLRQVQAMLSAETVVLETLPAELRADWLTADGRARVEVAPATLGHDGAALARFAAAVQAVAPQASGAAISTRDSSATVQRAFLVAGVIATVLVLALLLINLRSLRMSLLALAPLALAALLTAAHCILFGPELNLANIIALPLLFGMGVAYDIYYVAAWARGERQLLASPMNRAVIYSAVTNAAAFGALAVSPHPGTASMGVVLSVSLVYSLLCVMLVLPPLLKVFATKRD